MSISRNQRWKGEAVQELGVAKKDQNASVADQVDKRTYIWADGIESDSKL